MLKKADKQKKMQWLLATVIDSALAPHATSQIYTSQLSGYQKSCSNTTTHVHTHLHAESNSLNTYKKQWCKKYNSLNEKYTGKPNSKYKIFNSKAWPKWHVRWVQKWRKLNCWSTMWALTYYKHEKNMKRPSYSTKEVSMKTFVSAWKPLHPVSTKIQNITK